MKALMNDGSIAEVPEEEVAHVIRHSAAHILAQAIKRLYPQAIFAYGPATEHGFYYDVDLGAEKISDEDLPAIEAEMRRIVKENLRFETFELPRAEAVVLMEERGERYKVEHIGDLPEDARITFYRQGDYIDMCVGPHLMYTKGLKAFKLTGVSGAYWKADSSNKMLTRVSGLAFGSKDELAAYERLLAEAEKRDHRRIGREMELFMMSEAGPGFPFWLPNGMRVRNALMAYWQEMQDRYGYEQVQTPIILSRSLWETSGHWDHYHENMYTTQIDEEDYAVKPMNCPGACLIYKSRPRSYRELPLKLAEAGLDHRHELKGALHGLFRVREFTQDDAHLFIRPDQITEQVIDTAKLITAYYAQFGFPYRVELSTRPADSMGSDEDWERAEAGLQSALDAMGLEYRINPGDGAFYGPKIDFHLEDCLGRTWQCGTIQLDFQLPHNFQLEYVDSDGQKKQPIMIHRAGFGSFERFIGMLTEQYAGKFPTWLSPLQVKVLPVSEKARDYARGITERLVQAGLRARLDERDEKIGYKIREARSLDRVPYMLILGEKEAEAGTISVRDRTNETISMELDAFIAQVVKEVTERR
ncbi:threonine--tRNA ligase [Collinsella sp. AGMB00827]|uniref:Threonine--tRNA ligase n=1 Tax=Collinsella ureilytica TaxID=2869515 RepID=A0ABS7MKP7_9ACTN|nr:threonine--tRNA ligase [Collinsella urealyticum]MBY4797941.1 threonine--tRNA ligase [Collinsella urealyticum]